MRSRFCLIDLETVRVLTFLPELPKEGLMPAFVWSGAAILVGLMIVLEIIEGHAVHLAMIAVGLAALVARAKLAATRPIVGIVSATAGLSMFLAIGLSHWLDGRIELLDGVAAMVLLLLVGGLIGDVVGRKRKRAAGEPPKKGGAVPMRQP